MGATRPASVIVQLLFSVFCVSFLFIFPTRDASPPLEVAFCGCVLWLRYLYYTTNTLLAEYLTSYTNSLQLIDCQCFTQCKMLQIPPTRNLHNSHVATRTSTGGRCHGIGEQKSLLLQQISLRPYGVNPAAYVQIGCMAAGCDVQDVCRGVYDALKSSYTLGTIVYQLVTHKKCKMTVKVHTLVYR